MKIALDAAGGAQGPAPNIEGAILAANAWGVEFILTGPADILRQELTARGISSDDRRFELVDAPDVITRDEDPVSACRAKPRASILVAAELVAARRADALVSAGHPGATMTAALWALKRLPGILRPALAVPIPTPAGLSVLLDGGANTDCKPWHLVQFAQMGIALSRRLYGKQIPSVGLLSLGGEPGRDNELVVETLLRLKSSCPGFLGLVDARDVTAGKTDVVVCDGYAGNVLLKSMEGTVSAMTALLKKDLQSDWRRRLAGMLLKDVFVRLRRKMNYEEYGGAPILGIDGAVVLCHGSSSARAISHAVHAATTAAETGLAAAVREAVAPAEAAAQNAA